MATTAWGLRERLTMEKAAIGFFLSGHLFDAYKEEVRRFARRAIADLVDSREPVLLAGIVSDPRVVNGRSGRVAIFKLDDGSEAIEATASEDLLDANRELLREDELIVVQGKLQPDRFSGGLRLSITQVWDLAAARARFGRYISVDINDSNPPVTSSRPPHPSTSRRTMAFAARSRTNACSATTDIRASRRATNGSGPSRCIWIRYRRESTARGVTVRAGGTSQLRKRRERPKRRSGEPS